MPQISVIVSVYNCEEYIGETIQSIIDQTFTDWELIIIDDNSKDTSASVIESYADKDTRIRFVRNTTNQGQCANLNTAIAMSSGEYIAHTDHDDISYPDRLARQLAYMEDNPSCLLCGCAYDELYEGKKRSLYFLPYNSFEEVRFRLPMQNILAHSTFFWRRQALIDNHISYGQWDYAEDFDLTMRVLRVGDVGFMPDVLVAYRIFEDQLTQTIDPHIISSEDHEIRDAFILEQKNLDTDIWIRALNGELHSIKDYRRWDRLLGEYSSICALQIFDAVGEVNRVVYDRQTVTWKTVLSYAMSRWKTSFRHTGRLAMTLVGSKES